MVKLWVFFLSTYIHTPKFSVVSKKYFSSKSCFSIFVTWRRKTVAQCQDPWVLMLVYTGGIAQREWLQVLGPQFSHLLNERNGHTSPYSPKLLYDSLILLSLFFCFLFAPFFFLLTSPSFPFSFVSCLSRSLTCLNVKTLNTQTSNNSKIPTSL